MDIRMLFNRHLMPIALASIFLAQPAYACIISAPLEIGDVRYADVVVVGRVSNYRIIRDQEFRKRRLADRNLSPEERKRYEGPEQLLSDHARFDVQVDELLTGEGPDRFSVSWDNSTFGEPDAMDAGPFLLALRKPYSHSSQPRVHSATILPDKKPVVLTPLQAPCSEPFFFPIADARVEAIRRILKGPNPQGVPHDGTALINPARSETKRGHDKIEQQNDDRWSLILWLITVPSAALGLFGIVKFLRKRQRGGAETADY